MKKQIIIPVVLILIISSIIYFSIVYNSENKTVIPIRYGSVKALVEAPAHVAFHNGYFKDEGLDLSLEINPDGKTSLDRLLTDSIDIASVMATPVVYRSFNESDFSIFAVMEFSYKIHSCIARKDVGINSPADFKGRKLGVMKGTSGEFFMNSYLILNDLLPKDVEIVNLNGPELIKSINNGEIDAMFCWEPFVLMAKKQLKGNWIEFNSPKLVPSTWVFIAKKDYIKDNPEAIKRFIKAIVSSTQYTNENNELALNIHAEVTGIEKEIIAELFKKEIFNVSLKQELILDLEAQARWLIEFEYVKDSIVPNFLDIIHVDAMKEIIPEQVLLNK